LLSAHAKSAAARSVQSRRIEDEQRNDAAVRTVPVAVAPWRDNASGDGHPAHARVVSAMLGNAAQSAHAWLMEPE
jgi:hypothetical protein